MARKSKYSDVKQHWICEDCGLIHVCLDPPDICSRCAFGYFENLYDRQRATLKHGRNP